MRRAWWRKSSRNCYLINPMLPVTKPIPSTLLFTGSIHTSSTCAIYTNTLFMDGNQNYGWSFPWSTMMEHSALYEFITKGSMHFLSESSTKVHVHRGAIDSQEFTAHIQFHIWHARTVCKSLAPCKYSVREKATVLISRSFSCFSGSLHLHRQVMALMESLSIPQSIFLILQNPHMLLLIVLFSLNKGICHIQMKS